MQTDSPVMQVTIGRTAFPVSIVQHPCQCDKSFALYQALCALQTNIAQKTAVKVTAPLTTQRVLTQDSKDSQILLYICVKVTVGASIHQTVKQKK